VSAEAVRVPSAGAIFWTEAARDGSGASTALGGAPAMDVTLTTPVPAGTQVALGSRGLAVLLRPIAYDHAPTPAELGVPLGIPPLTIAGVVRTVDGRFHPRRFRETLSPATPNYVPLRRSLQATTVGEAGAVILTLRWDTGAPASWSVVLLSCVRNGVTLGFCGQADRHGDVIIPLTALPPLAPGQGNDSMIVRVNADFAQAGADAADPDALAAASFSTGAGFASQHSVTIVRGTITKGRDLGFAAVTLQSH